MTGRRVVVVSMPNVVPHNQLVYLRLAELGWDVNYVVPNRWRDEYSPEGFTPQPLEGIVGTFALLRVALPGQVQRHFYVTRPARWLRRWRPDAIFVELEPFSVPTLQWGLAAERLGIPWGVQGDENLDRPLPWPARLIRDWSMPRIDFFAARSPGGEQMLRRWGARAEIGIVPHTIPEWEPPRASSVGRRALHDRLRRTPDRGEGDPRPAGRRSPPGLPVPPPRRGGRPAAEGDRGR